MTIASAVMRDTFTPDGNTGTILSNTIPAGEIWFLDRIYGDSDGQGPAAPYEPTVGVGPSAFLNAEQADAGNDFSDLSRGGGTGNFQLDSTQGAQGPIGNIENGGMFGYPGEEVRVSESTDGGDGTNGTVAVVVGIRRVF